MKCEILMIGTELLLGQVQDTNATYMGQLLAEHGINLFQKTTVGDNSTRIQEALDAALQRSDVVLCSGGLGPTEDDITRECVSELLGRPLEFREDLYETLLARFARLPVQMTENNRKQAMLPRGAQAIPNPNGTAPGLLVDDPRGIIVCMPGVPRELHAMLEDSVVPFLKGRFGISAVLHYRVLKICALGESRVDSLIGDLIVQGKNPTIGLLASPEAVRIRIAARASSRAEAEALIAPVEASVRERLSEYIMGKDEETLEEVVGGLLESKGYSIGIVDTVTGGQVAQRLCFCQDGVFAGGLVIPSKSLAYRNIEEAEIDLKRRCLLNCEANCMLVVCPEPGNPSVRAALYTPVGEKKWELGFLPTDQRSQVRLAVSVLERVRRFLKEQ